MDHFETSDDEASAGPRAQLRFTADASEFQNLVLRHGALSAVTVGFYRFWMKTHLRRAIWRGTELDGDGFEYTGTPVELLIGTLIAVLSLATIFVVVNLGLVIVDLTFWRSQSLIASFGLTFLLFLPLREYAVFRARRYRLLRTKWRGIRFGMDGSGRRFVLIWAKMFALTVLSLGVFWPIMRVARERYMTNCMLFGDQRFRFEGSAHGIFEYWMTVWGVTTIGGSLAYFWIKKVEPGPYFILAVFIAFAYALFWVYCRYRAAELRLFMTARRVADVRVDCQLQPIGLIGPFWAVISRLVVPGIPIFIGIWLLTALAVTVAKGIDSGAANVSIWRIERIVLDDFATLPAKAVFLGALWINYGLTILFYMWLGTVVFYRRFHAHLCATTSFTGLASLDAARQRTADDQIESEGFADALDVGGL